MDEGQGTIFLGDILLALVNLWHLLIAAAYVHPVESPCKKSLLSIVAMISKVQCPLLTFPLLLYWSTLAFYFGYLYFVSEEETESTMLLIRAIVATYTAVCGTVCMKITAALVKLGSDHVIHHEREIEKYDIVNFKVPPLSLFDTVLAPLNAITRPEVIGIENVPNDRPCLFVMNHSLLGVEMGLFLQMLYRTKGFVVRGLADHFHFATPSGAILKMFGAVDGTRENVDILMESKQNILVYPGGGHEVLKHSSTPKYALKWKERVGFARMAIKHGYDIVPCASVGVEDMLDIVVNVPTGYNNHTIPVVKTNLCRLQKVYFCFDKPISTHKYNGDCSHTEYAMEVRDKTRASIESMIQMMKIKQEEDPQRYLVQQVKATITSSISISTSSSTSSSLLTKEGKKEE